MFQLPTIVFWKKPAFYSGLLMLFFYEATSLSH